MNITLDTTQVTQLAALWQRAPEVTREEVLRAVTESDLLVQGELMQKLPKGAGGRTGSGLAGTIFREEQALASNVLGLVASAQPYAEYVEIGTKAHMPPIQPLLDWVEAVIGLRGVEAEGMAEGIRWKQFHEGTKANPVWQETYQRLLPKIHSNFDAAAQRIVLRLAGGSA